MRHTRPVAEPIRDLLLSAGLAAALVAAAVGSGLHFHLEHRHVASAQERLLVAASRQLTGVSVVGRSAENHVGGYADLSPAGEQGCAAEASLLLRTSESPDQVQTALTGAGLPHIVVDRIARTSVRVHIYLPFGQNPLDWSCWQ